MTSKNWTITTIEECSTIVGDGLHGTPIYSTNGEYAFVNGNNLINGKIKIKEDTKRVSEVEFQKYKKPLNERTLLVSINGTLGNVAEYNDEKIILGKRACYFNIKSGIDKQFIKYILISKNFQDYLQNQATGTTIKNISLKQMRKYDFLLPPLETQQKIAKVLNAIDDKIELNNSINNNLEQQAQAIYKSWFVDFEPFGGVMPDDWEITPLDQICQISAGGDKPKEVSKIRTNYHSIPIYSNSTDNEGLYGYTTKAKINKESVTISARGTIGYTCLRLEPYVPIVRLITIEPNNSSISAKYLYHTLKKMNIIGYGTTQQQITVPYCKTFSCIIPSQEYMNKFNDIADNIYSNISNNKYENECLTQLRDTLLPKLMSGEIDVSNVEIG